MQSKGLWLPIEVINDKVTTFQEKLVLMEISQLSMLDKGCIASNNHFAELFQIKKEAVSRCINSLEKKGYINSNIVKGTRNHTRIITINKLLSDPKQNVILPLTNCSETKENKTENKTSNIDYDFFSSMWNEYAKKTNKSTILKITSKRKEKIRIRYKEVKDFKAVFKVAIDKAHKSSFLSKSEWFNFDWLVKNDTNIIKVIEDTYKDKEYQF